MRCCSPTACRTDCVRRFGLLAQLAGIALLVFLLVSYGAFVGTRNAVLAQITEEQVTDMRAWLNATQGAAQHFLHIGRPEGVREMVSAVGSEPDLRLAMVADASGRIIASTRFADEGRKLSEFDYGLDASIIERTTRTRTSDVRVDTSTKLLQGYVSICDPNQHGGLRAPHCGFLYKRTDLAHHHAGAVESLYRQAATTVLGFGFCAILLLVVFHRSVSRRVGRIVDALERFGQGDRSARAGIPGSDELATIGASVDQIFRELAHDELALRASERFKQAIIDGAHAAIISTDRNGVITLFSAGAERLLGYRAEELVGLANVDLFHDPQEARHRPPPSAADPLETAALAGGLPALFEHTRGRVYEDECLYVCKDGSRVAVSLSLTAVLDEEGQVDGYLAVARDIGQEREVARRLKLAKNVFDSAGEAILVTDPRMRVVDVNPAYLEMTGFARDEVIGQKPSTSRSGRHDRGFYRKIWHAVEENGFWRGELWDRRKNGELFPQSLTISAIKDHRGAVSNYVGIFKDVTSQKAAEEELERLAYYDPLTGLPNRALFKDRLQHEIDVAARRPSQVALLFIDLDRFKYVNDTLGHEAGDTLLLEAAARIKKDIRSSDTLARLGGDEFTLIIADADDVADAGHIARKIIDSLAEVFVVDGREVFIGASVGIAVYPDDGRSVSALTKNADTAMYLAKQSGRSTYRFFKQQMNAQNERRMAVEASLRRAIENQEFILHYQPKIDLGSRSVAGFEALLRWQHPEFGLIPPGEFIPLAEETGLILPISKWVLHAATAQLREWHAAGHTELDVAVNLCAMQFQDQQLVEDVTDALRTAGIEARYLELELTESLLMVDADRALSLMKHLRELGVKLSIDDFGVGYSSLSYLKRFPIQALKIDRSFVRDAVENPEDAAIVSAVTSLAATLQLKVVAEGVETDAQQALLTACGCDLAQGYLYARPLPASEVEAFLAGWKERAAQLFGDPCPERRVLASAPDPAPHTAEPRRLSEDARFRRFDAGSPKLAAASGLRRGR